ncbi:O-antigen ligase family protein [Bordetella tumulicola]|uniref:O-antigen ligase family protein n=1 Tax=Bordetella tumulicola TaxID=1649133 RepID=UPI0039EFC38B
MALLVPALALVSADGGPIALYLGAVVGLGVIIANAIKPWEVYAWRDLWPLMVALAAPLVCMLLGNIVHGDWVASEFEKLIRFALAIPIAWVLMRSPVQWLRHVQWSLLFSAYVGSLMLLVILLSPDLGRGAVSAFGGKYNAVAFANLTLFFGFASCLTLPWTLSRWPRLEAALKLLAVPLSIYAVWISETRSSWALFAVLGLVILLSKQQWTARTKLMFVGMALVFMAVGLSFLWYADGSRFRAIWTDFQRYEQHDRDTSTGIRMQLATASWLMFKESPWTGVGAGNFREKLAEFRDQGIVTPKVASDYGEPHNDFLGALAGYGMFGLLSILALYFVPAVTFLRRLRNADATIHTAATIGLLFTLGYAQFSLTEMMFRNMRSVPIYAVTLAVLYALSTPRHLAMADRPSTIISH